VNEILVHAIVAREKHRNRLISSGRLDPSDLQGADCVKRNTYSFLSFLSLV
jgi:hypothetical protein